MGDARIFSETTGAFPKIEKSTRRDQKSLRRLPWRSPPTGPKDSSRAFRSRRPSRHFNEVHDAHPPARERGATLARWLRPLPYVFAISLSMLSACGSKDDWGDPSGGQTSNSSPNSPSSGGAFQAAGGAFQAGRGGTASGGSSGGASSGSVAGAYPAVVPPPPASDGSSPYLRECHGDSKTCVDVANLRCLGIRDDAGVHGYSCSNPCASDSDCSVAPTSVAAYPACVDFVSQKHCLLVCLSNGEKRACPSGMNCYVYPSSPIGYCLWP
jgi:hypothetical protein